MACRGNLAVRAQRYCKQGFRSSFAYLHLDNDDYSKLEAPKANKLNSSGFIGSRSSSLLGFGEFFQNRRISKTNFSCLRYMSSSTGENVVEMLKEMKDAMENMEPSIASQAPAVNEVAVAAADSYFPSAAFQYLIDGVHSFSGLNWWTSIAVATILVRVIETPLMINHIKSMNGFKALLEFTWPPFSKVCKDFEQVIHAYLRSESSIDPKFFGELSTRIIKEVKPRAVNYMRVCEASGLNNSFLVPWNRLFVFLSTFFAIRNMVENVASFKSGGIYWFTDLTTPDSSYMLPVLTAVTYWMSVEGYKQTTFNLGLVLSEDFIRNIVKDFDKISYDEVKKILAAMMEVIHLIVMALIPVFIR